MQKEALEHIFILGMTCEGRDVIMQYFLKQDTFVMLTYFCDYFLFLLLYVTKFVFCQSAFVIFR